MPPAWSVRRARYLSASKARRRALVSKFRRNRYGTMSASRGWSQRAFKVGVEAKYQDLLIGANGNTLAYAPLVTLDPSSPPLYLLNGISTGTGPSNRIGTKIKMKSVDIRLEFRVNSPERGSDSTPGAVGYMLVLDTQPNGATFAYSDLFTTLGSEFFATSMINLNNRSRFKILARGMKALGGYSNTGDLIYSGGPFAVTFKKHKRLYRQVQYQGIDSSIASISSNALYLILLGPGNTGGVTNNSDWDSYFPVCNGTVRLRYYDA